jgi:hypothetical protein
MTREIVLFLGWTETQWQRAYAWARTAGIHGDRFAIRREWIERGGPISGPSEALILEGE